MKAKSNRILAVLLVLALCVLPACSGGAGATASGAGDSTAASSTGGSEDAAGQATPATIAIPGYETIEFAAGKTTQLVDLYNPDRNACDFRMTLVLDGKIAGGEADDKGEGKAGGAEKVAGEDKADDKGEGEASGAEKTGSADKAGDKSEGDTKDEADKAGGEDKASGEGKATSEGEVLWTSELVGPGERVGKIELAKSLEAGDYPATLKYECFTLGDGTPLNGSEVKLTLHVV